MHQPVHDFVIHQPGHGETQSATPIDETIQSKGNVGTNNVVLVFQNVFENQIEEVNLRKCFRASKLLAKLNDYVLDNKSKASKDLNWINAMNNEMQALYENDTWELVDLPFGKKPFGRKPIGSKCVFRIKYMSTGEIERYKAMLVSKGFNQREGIDYEETFSLVVKMSTIRLLACRHVVTHLLENIVLAHKETGDDKYLRNITSYQKLVWKLIYMCMTRPDISYDVHCLSQQLHAPLQSQFNIGLRMLRYLKIAHSYGIDFSKDNTVFNVTASTDSDWAKCHMTRRAMASATCEIMWVLKILKDLGLKDLVYVALHCDNKSAIQIAANLVMHEKTKHFDLDVHLASGLIKTVKVDSKSQVADILTKALRSAQHDENGIVSRNKARLVAQGYNQQEGIDYDETYALIARLESIRILLAIAYANDFKLYQMDVKSAFLNGFINEEVYVAQPSGFIDFKKLNYVYKLKKSLYGLKQSPKAWYDRLKAFFIKHEYSIGMVDNTLFTKKLKSHLIIVQIYVDEIIFGSTSQNLCDEFAKIMHDKFKMSMMGKLNFFLGLQIKRIEDRIFFNQSKYIKEMLKKFRLEDTKPTKTPMSTEIKLTKDNEADSVDSSKYRGMISSLLYLTPPATTQPPPPATGKLFRRVFRPSPKVLPIPRSIRSTTSRAATSTPPTTAAAAIIVIIIIAAAATSAGPHHHSMRPHHPLTPPQLAPHHPRNHAATIITAPGRVRSVWYNDPGRGCVGFVTTGNGCVRLMLSPPAGAFGLAA
ncbi:retrovirus-related pol polyprotein from transposon TNT 1-94 [Tanacetum coccineum]|uniref:Retrovirus-related pol polyprotein from transposon TNT 1-94 n=1 Tax=Tanacetum coccineum TaxID=301880 RepID=A0ABQ4XD72_9ASTR